MESIQEELQYGKVHEEEGGSSRYRYYIVFGRYTISLFNYIVNQIIEDKMVFDIYSPYSYNNSSVLYSQVEKCDE